MHQIWQNARPTIRERREKREPRSERERDDRASPHRRAARSTSALVGRAPLVDRWTARSSDERRARSSIVDRAARSTIAIVHRAARWRGAIVGRAARSSLSLWSGLSLLFSLFSLSLSLSLSLSFRKWIEVKMRGEIHFRVKGEICGQSEIIFPENNVFRDSQTHGFSGNWFLKLVFTRFKRSLNVYLGA